MSNCETCDRTDCPKHPLCTGVIEMVLENGTWVQDQFVRTEPIIIIDIQRDFMTPNGNKRI